MTRYMTVGCELGWTDANASTEERFEYVIVHNAGDIPEKKMRKRIGQWIETVQKANNPNVVCNKTYLVSTQDADDKDDFVRRRLEFLGDFIMLDFTSGEAMWFGRDGKTEEVSIANKTL